MKKIIIFLLLVPFIISSLQGAEAQKPQQQAKTYTITVTFMCNDGSRKIEFFSVRAGTKTDAFFERVNAKARQHFPARDYCMMVGSELFPKKRLPVDFLANMVQKTALVMVDQGVAISVPPRAGFHLVLLTNNHDALEQVTAKLQELGLVADKSDSLTNF